MVRIRPFNDLDNVSAVFESANRHVGNGHVLRIALLSKKVSRHSGGCVRYRLSAHTQGAGFLNRGTSLIRNRSTLGPYRRLMPRVIGGS